MKLGKPSAIDNQHFPPQHVLFSMRKDLAYMNLINDPSLSLLCSTLRRSWEQLKSETESAGRLHINLSGKIIEDLHHQLKEFREQQRDIRRKVNPECQSKIRSSYQHNRWHSFTLKHLEIFEIGNFSDLVGWASWGHRKYVFLLRMNLFSLKICLSYTCTIVYMYLTTPMPPVRCTVVCMPALDMSSLCHLSIRSQLFS